MTSGLFIKLGGLVYRGANRVILNEFVFHQSSCIELNETMQIMVIIRDELKMAYMPPTHV